MDYTWFLLGLVITILFLWGMLYLASRWIVSVDFASKKKSSLFISALIIVIILPLVAEGIGEILTIIGEIIVEGRNAIAPSGSNYLVRIVPVISFLVFLAILKFITNMEWRNSLWISLLGIILLYCLYSFFPELDLVTYI
ncbi:MAG: hypothetical protein GWO20_19170 [Candidatus Korarchaeota archaeon]|nr:hypothetical protein [Candidatus Korarchaeota archaeon]NIU85378.1 hypothetical protein [Candidatus Thorarchaeota archaeon]NIW15476.1 hypothetical protein [Candidatus Thorarchaeota archaeon]NIW53420.1 hypothetical protein [Candidatus Korarchaeota archaeon]